MKLCDVEFFTLENQQSIDMIHTDMWACSISLSKNEILSLPSYTKLTFGQQRLAEITTRVSDIRNKQILIIFHLLPYLEIIQKEVCIA